MTDAKIEEVAVWLSRDHPSFKDGMVMYFRMAAALLRQTRQDFFLLPLVFTQSVIGLERMLKLHFGHDKKTLQAMLDDAVNGGLIRDHVFSKIEPLPKVWFQDAVPDSAKEPECHARKLAICIPRLRNQFFHGHYILNVELLELTIQTREIVDALLAVHPRSEWSYDVAEVKAPSVIVVK
ncbi:hypothetical protein WJU23_19310 [Prosthecobacter sp. SYSU 5D2]